MCACLVPSAHNIICWYSNPSAYNILIFFCRAMHTKEWGGCKLRTSHCWACDHAHLYYSSPLHCWNYPQSATMGLDQILKAAMFKHHAKCMVVRYITINLTPHACARNGAIIILPVVITIKIARSWHLGMHWVTYVSITNPLKSTKTGFIMLFHKHYKHCILIGHAYRLHSKM